MSKVIISDTSCLIILDKMFEAEGFVDTNEQLVEPFLTQKITIKPTYRSNKEQLLPILIH